jgi:hypothetical protein
MKYLRNVKDRTRTDQLSNKSTRHYIFPLYEKIAEYGRKCKIYFQTMELAGIPLQAY